MLCYWKTWEKNTLVTIKGVHLWLKQKTKHKTKPISCICSHSHLPAVDICQHLSFLFISLEDGNFLTSLNLGKSHWKGVIWRDLLRRASWSRWLDSQDTLLYCLPSNRHFKDSVSGLHIGRHLPRPRPICFKCSLKHTLGHTIHPGSPYGKELNAGLTRNNSTCWKWVYLPMS